MPIKGKKKNNKVTCPKTTELVANKPTILEQKGVNTYDFDLSGVGKNAEFKIWFYTNQDRNFAYVGLREPIPGLVLQEGDHVKVEIKTQKYGGRNVDVLLKLYDRNMQLRTICGLYSQEQLKFIPDKIEVRATNIKALNKITCLASNASAKATASLRTAADDDTDNVPFKFFKIAEAVVKNDAKDNFTVTPNSTVAPLSFSNNTNLTGSAGRLLGSSQTGSNSTTQPWAAGSIFLAFTLFTLLLVRKLRNAAAQDKTNKQSKIGP